MGYDGTNCKRMHRYYKSYVSKRPFIGRFYFILFYMSGISQLKSIYKRQFSKVKIFIDLLLTQFINNSRLE